MTVSRMRRMSLIFVTDGSGRSRELRMPRFLFYLLASVVALGLLMPVILYTLSPQVFGLVEVTFGRPWRDQMESVQERSMELSRQLEELKETTRSIRRLAGVDGFESDSPDQARDDTNTPVAALAANRGGLPFLMGASLPSVDEGAEGETPSLFRYVPSIWPAAGWVTREFQRGDDPIVGTHFGLDIAAREGAPVLSAADGVVTTADWDQNLGWLVEIDHGYDLVTRYGHNATLRVDRGQPVRRGQIIALVGNTGRSTAPHLHYEVWKDGVPADPRGYLPEAIQWDDLQLSARSPG